MMFWRLLYCAPESTQKEPGWDRSHRMGMMEHETVLPVLWPETQTVRVLAKTLSTNSACPSRPSGPRQRSTSKRCLVQATGCFRMERANSRYPSGCRGEKLKVS